MCSIQVTTRKRAQNCNSKPRLKMSRKLEMLFDIVLGYFDEIFTKTRRRIGGNLKKILIKLHIRFEDIRILRLARRVS